LPALAPLPRPRPRRPLPRRRGPRRVGAGPARTRRAGGTRARGARRPQRPRRAGRALRRRLPGEGDVSVAWRFVPQLYRDSVSLMQLARRWAALPGVAQASAQMGTAANLALLREAGILPDPPVPRPDDLLLVLAGDGDLAALLDAAEGEVRAPPAELAGGGAGEARGAGPGAPPSVREAVRADGALDLALVSVPGDYAAGEALKALACGLDVMLFSDNVSVEQEVFLKEEAARRGRLVMGPDCGTAILDGAPLGFANQVRRGPVGLVSA